MRVGRSLHALTLAHQKKTIRVAAIDLFESGPKFSSQVREWFPPDNGKPVARLGRKATDLTQRERDRRATEGGEAKLFDHPLRITSLFHVMENDCGFT